MTDPRKQALRDLQRLGQEWDYPERLQEEGDHRADALRYALQDLPDPPDDHDNAAKEFAIAFCVVLSGMAIGLGVLANWMGWV